MSEEKKPFNPTPLLSGLSFSDIDNVQLENVSS